jgi:hypothetical protein
MTIKRWLNILMAPDGAPGGDGAPAEKPLGERIMAYAGDSRANFTSFHDASAEEDPDESGADDTDHQGNPGENDEPSGADATSEEDDQDADPDEGEGADADDTTSQEPDTGDGDTKPKRQSFDERVAEVVAKQLAERDASRTDEAPNFAPPETVKAVVKNIFKWEKQAEAIKAELDLLEDDEWGEAEYAQATELEKLKATVADARNALKENEKAQAEWARRQAQKKSGKESEDEIRQRMDEVAELYRQELKIDEKVWKQQGDWFQAQLKAKPLLVKEFQDTYRLNGDVAAIRFAHKYVTEHMGKDTKQKNDQRENNKTKAAGAGGGSGGKAPVFDLRKETKKVWDDPNLTSDEKFMRVQNLKRKASAG